MTIQAVHLSQFIPSNTTQIQAVARSTTSFIRYLAKKGGPDPSDYPLLNTLFQQFSQTNLQEFLSAEQLASIHDSFRAALSPESIQGWAIISPWDMQETPKLLKKSTTFIGHQCLI